MAVNVHCSLICPFSLCSGNGPENEDLKMEAQNSSYKENVIRMRYHTPLPQWTSTRCFRLECFQDNLLIYKARDSAARIGVGMKISHPDVNCLPLLIYRSCCYLTYYKSHENVLYVIDIFVLQIRHLSKYDYKIIPCCVILYLQKDVND